MGLDKVIYLQDGKLLFFDGQEFSAALPKDAKKFPVGAVIPSNLLQTYLFRTTADTLKDQLDVQVEIQIYENGGLDPNIEYTIDYLTHDIKNSDSVLVEVLALSNDSMQNYLKNYLEKIKIIDFIVPGFLIYKSLYTRGLSDDKIDLFLYISEDESFATIFKDGEYVTHKEIDSLNEMAQRSNIHIEELKKVLAEKGFLESEYEDDEDAIYDRLVEVFAPNIQKIINIVNNKRSIFGLGGIDRVIIDFDGKLIRGFDEFYSFMSYEEISYETVKIENVESEKIHEYIGAAYILDLANGLYDGLNFTIFERQPPFYKQEVIRLAMLFSTALLLNVLIDSYLIYKMDLIKQQASAIKRVIDSQKRKSNSLQKKLVTAQKKSEKLRDQLKQKKYDIAVYRDTLKALELLSSDNILRETFINDILITLQFFNLSTSKIVQYGSEGVEINLIAEYDHRERIAKFIEALSKKGYKDVSTGQISLINGVYESTVRIYR